MEAEECDGACDELAVEGGGDEDGDVVVAEAVRADEQRAMPEGEDRWTGDFDADGHAVRLSDFSAAIGDEGLSALVAPIVSRLRDQISVDYGVAYENLLNAANARLNRTLKDGFRMEGRLTSAQLEKLYLPADGVVIAFRASGDLKILYGM